MPTEEFNRLKDCRHGRMLYNINDQYIGRSLDLYGEYSEGEIELFSRIVRPGDLVIDVGANIGAHTVWFAKTTLPGGAVIAFEPQRLVFQTLCANAALNSLPNVYCLQKAVSDSPGSIIVPGLNPNQSHNFGGLPLGEFEEGDSVEVVCLDDLELPACRLIKADVEGMELDVLKGAADLIQRAKPVLYIENDRPDKSYELLRYVYSIGYTPFRHQPPMFNPNNFFGATDNVFGKIVSANLLCVPTGGQVLGLDVEPLPPPPPPATPAA